MKVLLVSAIIGIISSACFNRDEDSSELQSKTKPLEAADVQPEDEKQNVVEDEGEPLAVVQIASASGSSVSGEVNFSKSAEALIVEGVITGVMPPGKHGFHIHEFGDCSAKDASSAGGHFNPADREHGAPNTTDSHLGDLGNIEANSRGEANIRVVLKSPYYNNEQAGGWDAIIGKSVIVHEKADDLSSQPSGDAGKRIGCGVIKAVPGKSE